MGTATEEETAEDGDRAFVMGGGSAAGAWAGGAPLRMSCYKGAGLDWVEGRGAGYFLLPLWPAVTVIFLR